MIFILSIRFVSAAPNPVEWASSLFGGTKGIVSTTTSLVGWALLLVIICGAVGFGYFAYLQKKKYNKIIRGWEIIGGNFQQTFKDTAKDVKLGSGGFVVLNLRKFNTWKLAYGGRSGRNVYDFFIMPDGYWYNGTLAANMFKIDELKGFIPVQTTNPLMRAQYTALEKQIDTLYAEKKGFWEKYGNWVMSIGFVLIIGVLAWLIFKEIAPMAAQNAELTKQIALLVEKVNNLIVNVNNAGNVGLVKQ